MRWAHNTIFERKVNKNISYEDRAHGSPVVCGRCALVLRAVQGARGITNSGRPRHAWTAPRPFALEAKHYHFNYVNTWPKSYQQPHPGACIPSQGSRETIEWASDPRRPTHPELTARAATMGDGSAGRILVLAWAIQKNPGVRECV